MMAVSATGGQGVLRDRVAGGEAPRQDGFWTPGARMGALVKRLLQRAGLTFEIKPASKTEA